MTSCNNIGKGNKILLVMSCNVVYKYIYCVSSVPAFFNNTQFISLVPNLEHKS